VIPEKLVKILALARVLSVALSVQVPEQAAQAILVQVTQEPKVLTPA
jgi:hypothetical protein